MTYQEYRESRQKEINELPIKYAFGKEQFNKIMAEWGLEPSQTDKIYALGHTGGYYLRTDAEKIRAYFSGDQLDELMNDRDFREEAFEYEMANHEYCINYYQGDWDVLSCFGHIEFGDDKGYTDYLEEMGHPDWKDSYVTALRRYRRTVDV